MSTESEDLHLLRETALAWVSESAALQARRDDTAASTKRRWKTIGEMGWPAVAIAPEYDGVGLGFSGLGSLLEVLGRELLPSPLLSSAVIAAAVQWAGTDAQRRLWLPRLAAGEAAALALEESAHHRPMSVDCRADAVDGGWHLRGTKRYVADAALAELVLVSARTPEGIGLFVVESAQVERQPLQRVDGQDCAHVHFDTLIPQTALLDDGADATRVLDRILDLARCAQAAEMLGAAARALEICCDYLRTRRQFDQLIGSFQALQHRAAIMLVEIELTRSCVEAALQALDEGASPDVPELACAAKAMANRCLHLVSNEIVQMHGGIGMTAEHVAGLYLKRARVTEAQYGGSAFLAGRYADLKGF